MATYVFSQRAGSTIAFNPGTDVLQVDAGDAASLHDCLDRLLRDEALRRRLGERARRCFEEKVTSERMGRSAESFFRSLVAR